MTADPAAALSSPRVDRDGSRRRWLGPTLLIIGGSAGSFTPLANLVRGLPADLPAAVLVVRHIRPEHPSTLPRLLTRHGRLPAHLAQSGEQVAAGQVAVAPGGHHLLVHGEGTLALSDGPRVNRHRPSIDVTLASAAHAAGPRTVAVVLSGVLDDGAVGSALIARAGGQVLVQDPEQAEFSSMPRAALAAAPGASKMGPGQMVGDIVAAVRGAVALPVPSTVGRDETEGVTMNGASSSDPGFLLPGETRLTRLACPECGGAMAEVDLPQISYFRCHVGHQYAPQTLAAAQAEAAEAKLWSAVAALEERAVLQRYLQQQGDRETGAGPLTGADELTQQAATLRAQVQAWTGGPSPGLVARETDSSGPTDGEPARA